VLIHLPKFSTLNIIALILRMSKQINNYKLIINNYKLIIKIKLI